MRAEIARLEQLKQKVEQKIAENPKLAAMKSQIRLDMTADGLRIQIVDEIQRPMFASGSAVVQRSVDVLVRRRVTDPLRQQRAGDHAEHADTQADQLRRHQAGFADQRFDQNP